MIYLLDYSLYFHKWDSVFIHNIIMKFYNNSIVTLERQMYQSKNINLYLIIYANVRNFPPYKYYYSAASKNTAHHDAHSSKQSYIDGCIIASKCALTN